MNAIQNQSPVVSGGWDKVIHSQLISDPLPNSNS